TKKTNWSQQGRPGNKETRERGTRMDTCEAGRWRDETYLRGERGVGSFGSQQAHRVKPGGGHCAHKGRVVELQRSRQTTWCQQNRPRREKKNERKKRNRVAVQPTNLVRVVDSGASAQQRLGNFHSTVGGSE